MIDSTALDRVLAHILPAFQAHQEKKPSKVFILGLSGLQGSGKSTWAAALCQILNDTFDIHAKTLSLDDLYHCHEDLVKIRQENPGNPLLQTRGQPGTHDEALATQFFASLDGTQWDHEMRKPIRFPSFDKSQFDGEGDRVPEEFWDTLPVKPALQMVIFEGWCLGFQPLSNIDLEEKWNKARGITSMGTSTGMDGQDTQWTTKTLAHHTLENLNIVNGNLRRYCSTFMNQDCFDGFIHLTTDNLLNVYQWRLDQEHALRQNRGGGMSDVEVVQFVQGYMPSYELYLDRLNKESIFPASAGKMHVRVILDSDRIVRRIEQC